MSKFATLATVTAIVVVYWTIPMANPEFFIADSGGADEAIITYAVVDDLPDCYRQETVFNDTTNDYESYLKYDWAPSEVPTVGQFLCVNLETRTADVLKVKLIGPVYHCYQPVVLRAQ